MGGWTRVAERLIAPFEVGGCVSPALVAVYVLINALVGLNVAAHDPHIGYDAEAHLSNIRYLAAGHQPARQETYLFYMPPLGYAVPAALAATGVVSVRGVAKVAQSLNVLFSLLATYLLVKLAAAARPDSLRYRIAALGLLGMLPCYFKTFAFVRSEPLLVALGLLAVHEAAAVLIWRQGGVGRAAGLGGVLGLIMLTRQTGALIVIGIVVFAALAAWARPADRVSLARSTAVALLVMGAVSGWFYLRQVRTAGSPLAYNVSPRWGLPMPQIFVPPASKAVTPSFLNVFTDPVRPSLRGLSVPILYSETWGDYLCYFVVRGRDTRRDTLIGGLAMERSWRSEAPNPWLESNRQAIAPYLARVNAVSLLPTAIFLGGLALGLVLLARLVNRAAESESQDALLALAAAVAAVTLAGFAFFLLAYPSTAGDNAKATYILAAFPLLALLGAELLERLAAGRPRAYRWVVALLLLVALHNLPACVTRSTTWW